MEWQTEPEREGGSEGETGNLSNAQMTVGKLEPTIRPSTAGWIAACTVCRYVVRPDDVPSPPPFLPFLRPSESPRATRGRRPNQSKVKLKTLPPSPPLYRQPRPPPSLSSRRCLVCVWKGVWHHVHVGGECSGRRRRASERGAGGGSSRRRGGGRTEGGREGSAGSGLVLPVRRSVGRSPSLRDLRCPLFLSFALPFLGRRTA